jgi:hypothetical protein
VKQLEQARTERDQLVAVMRLYSALGGANLEDPAWASPSATVLEPAADAAPALAPPEVP